MTINKVMKKIVRVRLSDGTDTFGFLKDDIVEETVGEIDCLCGTGRYVPLTDCKLLPPLPPQCKFFSIAQNYNDMEKIPPENWEEAVVVLKPYSSLVGQGDPIVYPHRVTDTVHYESELGVIIGRKAKYVSEEDAPKYILGYTLVNDVTDREHLSGQWTFAKGHDTFLSVGPCIVDDDICTEKPVEGYLNGVKVQEIRVDHLIRPIAALISLLSQHMTLYPGDLICTGTKSGGGPMSPGDVFEVRHELVGTLRNPVIMEE